MDRNQTIEITKTTSYFSWPAIVVITILFWPLGIFLMYKRVSQEKISAVKNSKIIRGIAFIPLGMGILFASLLFMDLGTNEGRDALIGVSSIFIAFGLFLLFVSRNMKKDGMRYAQYYALVANEKQSDVNAIASAVGVEPRKAFDDLSAMINSGYFVGKSMYLDNQTIIYDYNFYGSDNETEKESEPIKPAIVQCRSCGANNTINNNGQIECEYCGSTLE